MPNRNASARADAGQAPQVDHQANNATFFEPAPPAPPAPQAQQDTPDYSRIVPQNSNTERPLTTTIIPTEAVSLAQLLSRDDRQR